MKTFFISGLLFFAALGFFLVTLWLQEHSAEIKTPGLADVLTLILSVATIAFPAWAAYGVSRDEIRAEMLERENERIQHVTSISATNLLNFHQDISKLRDNWSSIVMQYRVEAPLEMAMADKFLHMQDIIQSAMNTIIELGGAKENPFRLAYFETVIDCPKWGCPGEINATKLQPYPRAQAYMFCAVCKTPIVVRRRPDGTIAAWPASNRPDGPSSVAQAKTSTTQDEAVVRPHLYNMPMMTTVHVTCPNSSCRKPLTIQVNKNFPQSDRPCPECRTVMRYSTADGSVKIKQENFNHTLEKKDIYSVGSAQKIRCGCGAEVGIKYAETNSKGLAYLVCRRCGSIITDDHRILGKGPDSSSAQHKKNH